jgi:hypothetical protein
MILGLTLVLGWVLGLMSRSGGKKWKLELERERKVHQAAIRNRDTQIDALKTRTVELERARPVAHVDDRTDVHHRDSAIDNLDLTRRSERDRPRDAGYREDLDDGRTVIRPSRP